MALGFGRTAAEAGNHAWASILDGFNLVKGRYIYEWEKWQKSLRNTKTDRKTMGKNFRTSAAVLRMNESKKFPGGIVASLSIPWGQARGDDDIDGYHMVWPRDLVESSGGFLALKVKEDVLCILNYLISTQEKHGKWSQYMWLGGVPYLKGVQMDQVALPVLLVETCYHCKFLR